MDSLPDEPLFDILSRFLAEDIHQNARLVCKRWKRIIHGDAFAQAHLRRADYGLVLSTWRNDPPIFMAATRGGGIEVSELSSKSESRVKASCNGLVLVTFPNYLPYVVNPATKGCFKLPKFRHSGCFGIAYAAASMKYKVVAADYFNENRMLLQCKVLTVEVDTTWRHVPTQQLSPKAKELLCPNPWTSDLPCLYPLITEGFMHWASTFLENAVLTLNIETEVFVETPAPLAPLEYEDYGAEYYYLSTGSHLSVLIRCGEFLWQVWEMEGGSGEWIKVLPDIDLNAHKSKIHQLGLDDEDILRPIGWVKYPEVLIFFPYDDELLQYNDTNSRCIIYNLEGDEINSIQLPVLFRWCEALVHKNSLVVVGRDLF